MIKFICVILPLILAFSVATLAVVVIGTPLWLIGAVQLGFGRKKGRTGHFLVMNRRSERLAYL